MAPRTESVGGQGSGSSDASLRPSYDLLARAQGGDAEALQQLLQRYRLPLLERIRAMMGPRARRHAESGDFLQTVYLDALDRLEELDFADEQRFLRWMTAVARNRIRNDARRHRPRALESLSFTSFGRAEPGPARPSPASEVGGRELGALVRGALERMSREHRRVIELRELSGWTFPRIGAELAISDDAARLLHLRAMAALGDEVARLR